MPIFDVFAVALALAVAFTGGAGLKLAWDRRDAETRGRRNAIRDGKRRLCRFCDKSIDPAIDHYIKPYWYHKDCEKEEDRGH